jgi:hypothetical protein
VIWTRASVLMGIGDVLGDTEVAPGSPSARTDNGTRDRLAQQVRRRPNSYRCGGHPPGAPHGLTWRVSPGLRARVGPILRHAAVSNSSEFSTNKRLSNEYLLQMQEARGVLLEFASNETTRNRIVGEMHAMSSIGTRRKRLRRRRACFPERQRRPWAIHRPLFRVGRAPQGCGMAV